MKILIAYAQQNEIQEFLDLINHKECPKSFLYKHIFIDFCETGHTAFETAFNLGGLMKTKRYHLVIFAGLANSLNNLMLDGQVLNVINDIPYQVGLESEHDFKDVYQLNLLDKNKVPHQRGGFINLTNAYFNVFINLMKTASLTTNVLGGNEATLNKKIEHYPIHIETLNGISFQYACLFYKQSFYQLRAVEQNLILKTENKALALKNLNEELKKIVDLI